jgi:hypothetical protein
MKIYVSHGAGDGAGGVDWFVVKPPAARTLEAEVESLLKAGRTVYELDVVPWKGNRGSD